MNNFFSALEECLDIIDRGGDLESCLSSYPKYEELLRTFLQMLVQGREQPETSPEPAPEQVSFDQALDECIKAVGDGESPESCYERYPAYARKMRPWLVTVVDLRRHRILGQLQPVSSYVEEDIPDVPFTQALEEYLQALQQNKSDVILERYPYYAEKMQFWADQIPNGAVQQILPPPKPVVMSRPPMRVGDFFSNVSLRMSVAASLALFIFLFSGLSLANAAASLPGDSLYPLKLTIEKIQLGIGSNDQKAELTAQFAEERRSETTALIQAGQRQDVAFDGEITFVDQNKVMVSNVTVLTDGVEEKLPALKKCEKVHVEGYTDQKGVVIKIIGVSSSNGESSTFVASTPTPSLAAAVLTPTHTFTVQASPTPTLTSTATSTLVPTSASTATPTLVPTLTSTDVPTLWPTLTSTETPTLAPTLTSTDVPTLWPTWTPTDVPTLAPTWTATDVPTLVPTDQPTATSDPSITLP